jgi:hypothetical protein
MTIDPIVADALSDITRRLDKLSASVARLPLNGRDGDQVRRLIKECETGIRVLKIAIERRGV